MKTLFALLTSFFMFHSPLNAQTHFEILAGVSPGSNPTIPGKIIGEINPLNEFIFNMEEASPQYAGGLKIYLPVSKPFFHEIGVIYTRRTLHYSMDYTYHPSYQKMKVTEDLLHVPASIGVRMGILDVTSGLTGIISLSTNSELDKMPGYETNVKPFRMGWHTGLRVNIGPTALGIEYQGELNRVGQGMSVNGESLELRNIPGVVMATVQYKF